MEKDEQALPERSGVVLGPVGEDARRTLTRLRKAAGLSLSDLSARMDGVRRLSVSGLSKLETGGRKMDIDDLVAIAAALDVSPLAILFGQPGTPVQKVEAGGTRLSAASLWAWAVGQSPLREFDERGFQARSLPWWLTVRATLADGEIGRGDRRHGGHPEEVHGGERHEAPER